MAIPSFPAPAVRRSTYSTADRSLGFRSYVNETEETPLVFLVISVAYVAVSLVFVLTLLTSTKRSNDKESRKLQSSKQKQQEGCLEKIAEQKDPSQNHPQESPITTTINVTSSNHNKQNDRQEVIKWTLPENKENQKIEGEEDTATPSCSSSPSLALQQNKRIPTSFSTPRKPPPVKENTSDPKLVEEQQKYQHSSHAAANSNDMNTATNSPYPHSTSNLHESGEHLTNTTASASSSTITARDRRSAEEGDSSSSAPSSHTYLHQRLDQQNQLHGALPNDLLDQSATLTGGKLPSSAPNTATIPGSQRMTPLPALSRAARSFDEYDTDVNHAVEASSVISAPFTSVSSSSARKKKHSTKKRTKKQLNALPSCNIAGDTDSNVPFSTQRAVSVGDVQFLSDHSKRGSTQRSEHHPPRQQQQVQQSTDLDTYQATMTEDFVATNVHLMRPLRSWDLMSNASMRFRHGHFSGRSVQRLVQQERHAQELSSGSGLGGFGGGSSVSFGGDGLSRHSSAHSRRTGFSGLSQQHRRGAPMSEVASEMLETQTMQGEAEFYRQRYVQKSAAQRQQHLQQQEQQQQQTGAKTTNNSSNHRIPYNSGSSLPNFRRLALLRGTAKGTPSVMSRTSSGRSRMPALSPDVVSPEDAADAFDTGRSLPGANRSESGENNNYDESGWLLSQSASSPAPCCANLLDLAEPDDEVRRILLLAAPSTLGAVAEPFFRLGMVAIISHFIGTDSMTAFVLVTLFVRITTEELSGAVTDAESSMLHQALSMGGDTGFFLAGRQIQMAVLMQLLLAIPILVVWAFVMEDLVSWLVSGNDEVAPLAAEYTRIIVVDYALQAASRTFMLVFHLTGQAQFELHVDLILAAVTIAAVALTASLSDEPSLSWIAWVQVVVGVIKVATKAGIVVYKGLLKPYRKGLLFSMSFLDRQGSWAFIATTTPLLLGSLIELREWEILLLFIRHLGGAEVAAWALMGILWEIFEASTEGLGEAAAVRVSLMLSENFPELARRLAHKSVLLGMVLSLVVTAVFLLLGRNLSVALTRDTALQNLFNDLVGSISLANISMSMSQVYWSLLGSQGRFGVASSSILLCRWLFTMPLAAFLIFWGGFDLDAIASAMAMGYMTSTVLLAWRLFQSDWASFAESAKEEVMFGDDEDDENDIVLNDDNNNNQGHNDGDGDGEDHENEEDYYDDDESSSDCSTGFG